MATNTRFIASLGLKKFNNGTSTGLKSSSTKNYQPSLSPVDAHLIGAVSTTSVKEYDKVIRTAQAAFEYWRMVPAPKRGEIVRQYGEALRKHKDALGRLVSYEKVESREWGAVSNEGWNCTR